LSASARLCGARKKPGSTLYGAGSVLDVLLKAEVAEREVRSLNYQTRQFVIVRVRSSK